MNLFASVLFITYAQDARSFSKSTRIWTYELKYTTMWERRMEAFEWINIRIVLMLFFL